MVEEGKRRGAVALAEVRQLADGLWPLIWSFAFPLLCGDESNERAPAAKPEAFW